jgi:hypothetical protein
MAAADVPVQPRLTPVEAATTLDRKQFRRYLQVIETEAALQRGDPPPSALGRLFKPAATERKLVLFTLGIIVVLIVVTVFVVEMWGNGSTTVSASLVTLAGTGLGFIGGMVADRKPASVEQDRSDQGAAGARTGDRAGPVRS